MKIKVFAVLASAFFFAGGPQLSTLLAQGMAFTYQGRLTDGGNAYTGSAEFQATLWSVSSGGMALASNSPLAVIVGVTNGLFVLPLDFGPNFPGANRWLQLEVRTSIGAFTVLAPRQALTAAPYAITASNLSGTLSAAQLRGTVASANLAGTYSSALTLNNAANTFTGSGAGLTALNASQLTSGTVPAAALGNAWRTSGNAGTTPGTHSLGTTDNQPLELKVNGTRALRLEPTAGAPNVIGGAAENQITPNSAGAGVLSGTAHRIFNGSDYSIIAGGISNTIQIISPGAAIGGGRANWIVNSSTNSVIAGGGSNQISRDHSFIGGGLRNTNRSSFAVMGGGRENTIDLDAIYSNIAGGQQNTASAPFATVSGGFNNTASGAGSFGATGRTTVSGGEDNQASAYMATVGGGGHNTASGEYATVSGGTSGTASGFFSVVSGGTGNTAGGFAATVPGGSDNLAQGDYSFAAGRRAKANHPGAFVWADSTAADFASQRDDQFRVRAEGGARFDFNVGEWVDMRYQSNSLTSARIIHTSSGGYLSLGGTWVNASDRERKTHFTPVDPQVVLAKVAAMPLSEWSYRNEGERVRHVGPMAQDFHAAFGLGGDEKSITTVDADGVALAAIQGLNQKLEEKETRIAALEAELGKLKQLLEKSPIRRTDS